MQIKTDTVRDCCGGVEQSGSCTFITNNGSAAKAGEAEKLKDQRRISTIPAPPEQEEVIHAERELYEAADPAHDIVEGEHGYLELPHLKGKRAPLETRSLLDIEPKFRGTSPGFIAGFTGIAFSIEGQPPEIVREYTRGQAAANGVEFN